MFNQIVFENQDLVQVSSNQTKHFKILKKQQEYIDRI